MNDYCVYAHKDSTGTIFYIGSGRTNRAYSKNIKSRGRLYLAKLESIDYKFHVEILHSELSKSKSEELEVLEYSKHIDTLTNRKQPSFTKDVNIEMFRQVFEISNSSPSGLVWKINTGVRGKCGEPAGSINNTGYYLVQLNGIKYMVSRIIVILDGRELKRDEVVDHIDGNTINNSVTNLRVVSQQKNCRNKSSSSKTPGICLRTIGNNTYYIVQWYLDNSRKSKSFKVIDGNYSYALESATNFRIETIKEINTLGGEYTERHIGK